MDKTVEDQSKFLEVKVQDEGMHPVIKKENSISYYINRCLKKVNGYAIIIPSVASRVNFMDWRKYIRMVYL